MAVSIGQVEQLIEKIAPRHWAEDWDNPGLLIGNSAQKVDALLLSLDVTMA
jgi:putative NIF3 family GTP cyclohydrolase 1 type 2